MYTRILIGIGLLLNIGWANADALNIQLSNQSARFIYAAEVFGGQFGPTDLEVAGYFNEDDDTVVHVGLLVRNDSLDNPLVISIGARAYYGDVGNAQPNPTPINGAVIALGGELLFIPQSFNGLGVGAYAFVAPSVLSFMDADGFAEYGFIVDYAITEQSSFYVGYRNIEFQRDNNPNIEVDSSFIYGLVLRF